MARYDRIAPLTSPARDHAFSGWPVLRDIEGQDRDADVCRRARLRFLALRAARRALDRPADGLSEDSYARQLGLVRDELNNLPARDVERVRVTRFLKQIEDRDVQRLIHALLEYSEQAFAGGHVHAAEEFARTAEIAQPGVAQKLLERIGAAEPAEDDDIISLETGWDELRVVENNSQRMSILEQLGRSLLGMKLLTAADRCFALIAQRPADLSLRSRARAAHALTAALAGDAASFRERRTSLLSESGEWAPDPRVAASVHIDLAHGCVAVGDVDFAREHVRAAITIARRQNYGGMLKRAEGILTALEQNTEVLLYPRQSSTETSQRIAAQIELLDLPAPAN